MFLYLLISSNAVVHTIDKGIIQQKNLFSLGMVIHVIYFCFKGREKLSTFMGCGVSLVDSSVLISCINADLHRIGCFFPPLSNVSLCFVGSKFISVVYSLGSFLWPTIFWLCKQLQLWIFTKDLKGCTMTKLI